MAPAKIMIVENERITATDLHDALTQMGYIVTATVATGADAIREAERALPDLVIMDIHIQGEMDGIEAARAIRRRFDIPSVYLTAHADRVTLSRAKWSEPLGYLLKPFQDTHLQAVIEMSLHKHMVDRDFRRQQGMILEAASFIGDAIISVDRRGLVTFINRAGETLIGWQRADAMGKRIEEVLRLKPPETAARLLGPVLSAGSLATFADPSILIAKNGKELGITGSLAPIRDNGGEVIAAILVLNKIKPGQNQIADQSPAAEAGDPEIIVESREMKQLLQFAQRIAASEISAILIEGESGTGKDVLAKYLHAHGTHRRGPFLAINCAAIPETLMESELFGYEKGAFTDARQQKKGILDLASGGTVFLDEIGDMPLLLQAKLLRVLEEQSFRRLGGINDIKVNLRIITATNKDLGEAIQQGRFRLDLYHRLNVIRLEIPPLRARKEDILPLAHYFLRLLNPRFKRQILGFSPPAARALLGHDWPGNVREVRNAIERAMVLEQTSWIQLSNLGIGLEPGKISQITPVDRGAPVMSMSLEKAEVTMLMSALEQTDWNQTRAAQILGVTRDTLRYKMKKFGLRHTKNPLQQAKHSAG